MPDVSELIIATGGGGISSPQVGREEMGTTTTGLEVVTEGAPRSQVDFNETAGGGGEGRRVMSETAGGEKLGNRGRAVRSSGSERAAVATAW